MIGGIRCVGSCQREEKEKSKKNKKLEKPQRLAMNDR